MIDSLDLVRDALVLSLMLSAPILAVGLLVGLTVSIVQAVTQIQDQTLSFVPKIAAMLPAWIWIVAELPIPRIRRMASCRSRSRSSCRSASMLRTYSCRGSSPRVQAVDQQGSQFADVASDWLNRALNDRVQVGPRE